MLNRGGYLEREKEEVGREGERESENKMGCMFYVSPRLAGTTGRVLIISRHTSKRLHINVNFIVWAKDFTSTRMILHNHSVGINIIFNYFLLFYLTIHKK